ncbi:uroporphyrinogen-III synthase [Aquimixticola soesokkakensis]|uniref:Uroporphyrinogen-III synthase n=1 Tax=Aquimixticola soesokkakensis TaxID=1519096 RepID=A0A1Y5R9K1_9RHOB|nr:uroporphyrinogen-III synthase [Aquimixticola soesokkakensis]SLN12297.1 uroporphyrinogen-III synthase [Aquimixticola soesokkakensis]
MTDSRPLVLVTRPAPQAQRFGRALRAVSQNFEVLEAPVMKIVPVLPQNAPMGQFDVILTSAHAVFAAARLAPEGTAWCVGARTAQAARAAGLRAVDCGGTAQALVTYLRTHQRGPCLYLHGEHRAVDIAEQLNSAAIETHDVMCYRQIALDWPKEVTQRIKAAHPLVLPLFSARSAQLVSARMPDGVPIALVSLSQSVDAAWRGPAPIARFVAGAPTQDSLIATLMSPAVGTLLEGGGLAH